MRFPVKTSTWCLFYRVDDISSARGVKMSDLWGWTDPETKKEYVLAGRNDGTSFIDISDPSFPVFVGDLPKTEGSLGSVWRDIKVYKDHAYIVADGARLTRYAGIRPAPHARHRAGANARHFRHRCALRSDSQRA